MKNKTQFIINGKFAGNTPVEAFKAWANDMDLTGLAQYDQARNINKANYFILTQENWESFKNEYDLLYISHDFYYNDSFAFLLELNGLKFSDIDKKKEYCKITNYFVINLK